MKLKFIPLLLLSFHLVSCSEDKEEEIEPDIIKKETLLVFKSEIVKEGVITKTLADTWAEKDAIGVYLKENGEALSQNTLVYDAHNLIFLTTGNGTFIPKGEPDKVHLDVKQKFDVIAYYPQKDIQDFSYSISLKDQTNQEVLNLMYANNLVDINASEQTLTFNRQLAKVSFTIRSKQADLNVNNALSVQLKDFLTEANFSLIDGSLTPNASSKSDITLQTTANGNEATAEATILPGTIAKGVVTISMGGKDFTFELPENINYEKGKKYVYQIDLEGELTPIVVKDWIEIPALTKMVNTIMLKHMLPDNSAIRNYTMLYDTVYKLSYWVAYPLHASYIGTSGRNDAWQYDPIIDTLLQPAIRMKSFSAANFDRGHQMPSADRTYSVAGNESTFYFTNLTAQDSELNRETWAELEKKVRVWTKQCDTLYVVTGAMVTTNTDKTVKFLNDNYKKPVAVPKYYYKALAKRIGDTYYTLGFKLNNEANSSDFNNYRLTISDLEKETGFTFFPDIPKESKTVIDINKWK